MNYLDGLNPTQLGAVQHFRGPALVDAGPGSGKTKTISTRIAHLLDKRVPSGQILAVSFTRKSTQEMAERVKKLSGQNVTILTFHKWAITSLKDAGIRFSILDPNEQEEFFARKIDDEKLMRRVMTTIDRAKNNLFLNPQSWSKSHFAETFEEETRELIMNVWKDYQNYCDSKYKVDFTDILTLFYSNWKKEVQKGGGKLINSAKRFNHFMVDEFQDTNLLQLKLVKLWANRHEEAKWQIAGFPTSLLVCGDADQAIYSFRGGEPKIFLDFPKTFDGTAIFNLGENYRSQKKIVEHAISVISNNNERTEKAIKPMRQSGSSPIVYGASTGTDEIEWVATEIENLKKSGEHEIAILSRHNETLADFRKKLEDKGISTRSENFLKLPELEVVRNLLKTAVEIHPQAVEKSVPEKLSSNVRKAFVTAKRYKISLFDALASDIEMKDWLLCIRTISSLMNVRKYSEALTEAFAFVGLLQNAFSFAGKEVSYFSRLETIFQLIENAKTINFESSHLGVEALIELLANEASVSSPVELATFHGSKGCEWKHVFLVGLNSSVFPGEVPDELEEERRLYYVGVTRAKDSLRISGIESQLCPFVGEMLLDDIDWSMKSIN